MYNSVMTVPYERYRAIVHAREWLRLNSDNRRLPQYIQREMRNLLRHYPSDPELECIAADSPDWLEAEPDPFVEWVNENSPGVDND